jgi:hypothetical protein
MKLFLFLLIALAIFSCEEEKEEIERGERQQACYKDNTCVEGLKCEDNKCVDIYLTEEDIPDENFRKCLETDTPDYYNNWSETRELNLYNLIRIRLLDCGGREDPDLGVIVSIKGIEYLKNLEIFIVRSTNKIEDISYLSELTNLTRIGLSNSTISDISILKNLTKLEGIGLFSTQIEDISALKNLTNLERLLLDDAKIVDLTPLSNLTKLKYLWLNKNYIEDISPLNSLVNLDKLRVYDHCVYNCYTYYDHDYEELKTICPDIQNLIDKNTIDIDITGYHPEVCEGKLDWDDFLEN